MAQTGSLFTLGLDSGAELDLGGARAGNETGISGDGLDDVDTVVDGTLDVVEVVLRGAAEDQGGCAGDLVLLTENSDTVTANLHGLDNVDVAHFVGHRGSEAGERGGADDAADSAQLKLAEDANGEDAETVEVVHGKVADAVATDDDAEARVVELLDGGLELGLLAGGVVHHLFGAVQQNGALGLGLAVVDRAGVDTDLCAAGLLDGTIGLLGEDHAADDLALVEAAAHDLDDADVVDVEVDGVLGQDGQDGLGDETGEDILVAVLLAGNDGAQGLCELFLVAEVLDLVDGELLEGVEGKLLGLFVADDDVGGLEAHAEEVLGLAQQLTGEDDDEVGVVAHLGLLLLRGHDEELGGGVDDVELAQDRGGVGGEDHLGQVVDDDLVAAVGAERGLDGLRNGSAGIDVAEDGAIFGVVAVKKWEESAGFLFLQAFFEPRDSKAKARLPMYPPPEVSPKPSRQNVRHSSSMAGHRGRRAVGKLASSEGRRKRKTTYLL